MSCDIQSPVSLFHNSFCAGMSYTTDSIGPIQDSLQSSPTHSRSRTKSAPEIFDISQFGESLRASVLTYPTKLVTKVLDPSNEAKQSTPTSVIGSGRPRSKSLAISFDPTPDMIKANQNSLKVRFDTSLSEKISRDDGYKSTTIVSFLQTQTNEKPHTQVDTSNVGEFTNTQSSSPLDESLEQDECENLFVNYLPRSIDDQGLRKLFAPFGEIQSSKVMMDLETGRSRCFGFVKFLKVEQAKIAMKEMNGKHLEHKTLVIKYALFADANFIGTPSVHVYVKGLPETYEATTLKLAFQKFGEIDACHILIDLQTRLSRGVGFLKFKNVSSAKRAVIEYNGIILEGTNYPVVVKFADTEQERSARKDRQVRRKRLQQLFSAFENPSSSSSPVSLPPYSVNNDISQFDYTGVVAERESQNFSEQQQHYNQFVPNPRTISPVPVPVPVSIPTPAPSVSPYLPYFHPQTRFNQYIPPPAFFPQQQQFNAFDLVVSNISPQMTNQSLFSIFAQFGQVLYAQIVCTEYPGGVFQAFGRVRMTHYEDACSAVEHLNGSIFDNSPLIVAWAQ